MIKLYRYIGDHSWEECHMELVHKDDQVILRNTLFRPGKKSVVYDSVVKGTKTKSPEDRSQGVLESKVNEKIRKKGWSKERVEQKVEKAMAFENYDDYKHRLHYPVLATVKLDGVNTTWSGDKQCFMSKGNKHQPMPHLEKLMSGVTDDISAEFYVPGFTVEEINSMVSHQDNRIELHMYMNKRVSRDLNPLSAHTLLWDTVITLNHPKIQSVHGCVFVSEKNLDDWYEGLCYQGAEGIVVWSNNARWEEGRSKVVLKRKPLYRDELKVVNVTYDEDTKGHMIAFICECKGTKFKVVPKWTKDRRIQEYKRDPSEFIGQELTVEHRGFTKYGVPKHAKGIEFKGE